MTNYDYYNVNLVGILNSIHISVLSSEMTNKSIDYCRWDEADNHLGICFNGELSGADKILLDAIVETVQ